MKSWADIRSEFPILSRQVNGQPLTYLDNGATTQKPMAVLDAIRNYYETTNANVHRAIHTMGEQATVLYEEARDKVTAFIGAGDRGTVVFTRNATEALNLVAYAWARPRLRPGDAVVTTVMEHHSNLVTWQQVCKHTGAEIRYLPIRADGTLDLSNLDRMLDGAKLVAVTMASNVLGTMPPVAEIIARAHAVGALVLLDGAQYVPQRAVNVAALGCDFMAFTGHKMLGPTGIGALYGKREHLEEMVPFLFGGEMISSVRLEDTTWNEIPHKFEAGTPNIAGAIGLGAAVDYLTAIGMDRVQEHEQQLVRHALQRLAVEEGITLYGPRTGERAGLVAFNLAGIHAHDVAAVADSQGVAVRAGNHCAEPLHLLLGVAGSCRASFYVYNNEADVDQLIRAVRKAREIFHAAV